MIIDISPKKYVLGMNDALLVAKIMDHMDEEALKDLGFSYADRVRASWVYDDLDATMTHEFGKNWDEVSAT